MKYLTNSDTETLRHRDSIFVREIYFVILIRCMVRYIIDISPILDTGCLDQGEISVHNYYIKYYYITKLLQQQYGGPWARV